MDTIDFLKLIVASHHRALYGLADYAMDLQAALVQQNYSMHRSYSLFPIFNRHGIITEAGFLTLFYLCIFRRRPYDP